MIFSRFLAPLLGVLFLAIASLVGAGVANAHQGHAHARAEAAAAPIQVSPALGKSAVPAPSAAAETSPSLMVQSQAHALGAEAVPGAEAPRATSFDTAVSAAPDREPPGAGCAGMCCDNTPCGGCVKMAFGKALMPTPLVRAWLPASVEARPLSGRLTEGPNKPPRTLI